MTPAEIVADVLHRMSGWNGSKVATLEDVARVAMISTGDHLEIGTFFGASAIVFALARASVGKPGRVYCVDPFVFEDQESDIIKRSLDTARDMEAVFWHNVDLFDIRDRITLVKKPSQPVPNELNGLRFGSVFIDGLHVGETPKLDALFAMSACDGYIVLDDVTSKYPDIITAYMYILGSGEWKETGRSIHAVTFRKVGEL